MWFFIVALMVVGAFFLGAIFACIIAQDTKLDRKFIKEELKVITDALKDRNDKKVSNFSHTCYDSDVGLR